MDVTQARETQNQCTDCGHFFTALVVLFRDGNWKHVIPGRKELKCPKCGGDYWRWLNYETDFAKHA